MDLNTISEIARPTARDALPKWRVGDAYLGGGTWLFSEPQPRLKRLIDLTTLGWTPLTASADGLEIAATCTVAQLDAFAPPPAWTAAPLINQCCKAFLASFKIWNTATVGGNICMSLPAGPMISLTAALDGVALLWAQDGSARRVPVTEFVTGPLRNVLQPGEVLRSILLPISALSGRAAFRQISLANYGRSGALVIGTLAADGAFALTVTAATPRPIKLTFDTIPTTKDLQTRIDAEIPVGQWYDDIHGAPAWRRHMTLHFAQEIQEEIRDELNGTAR
jgi:CO/xanthine dehydrogenase FAD-binding subunit